MRKNCVANHDEKRTGGSSEICARPSGTPTTVPIAIARKLIAMLSAKPCSSSGVHLIMRGDDARLAGRGLSLRLADADCDEQRDDERHAVPDIEAPRLGGADAERLEHGQVGAVRDHAGAYPGMRSARSHRPITQTSTPTSAT